MKYVTPIVLCLLAAGCSLLSGNPVPPLPPPAPEIGAASGKNTIYLVNQFDRNAKGQIVDFKALKEAQKNVADAQNNPQVGQVAAEELAQAKSNLDKAEDNWETFRSKAFSAPQALAQLDHHSYMANRWAQIALVKAGVETGLNNLAQTQQKVQQISAEGKREKQSDARWLGQPLLPGEFGNISFALGTARLTGDSQPVVQRLAEFMQKHPRYALQIDGYTDNSPPSPSNLQAFVKQHSDLAAKDESAQASAYNLDVSRRRALALAEALAAQGIDNSRLQVRGFGQSEPIADNDTAAGRRKNRRVTVTVVKATTADKKAAADAS